MKETVIGNIDQHYEEAFAREAKYKHPFTEHDH